MTTKHKSIALFLGLLIGLCSHIGLSAQGSEAIPASERQVLIDIYNSTNGKQWGEDYRWNLNKTPNDWWGVIIENGHVSGLALGGVGLEGQLPASLFTDLPYLIALDVRSNRLQGNIPKEINNLVSLEALFLGSNLWSGTLPALDKLVNLRYLDLSSFLVLDGNGKIVTMVDATLPDLSVYKELESFDGSFSAFKGEISPNIGKCKKLRSLDLTANLLTGSLPESLNECYDLRILSVQMNRLSGSIPDLSELHQLGQVDKNEFGRLYLNDNRFTGEFPLWVTSLQHLGRFSCANNRLSGALPQNLSGMASVTAFFADHNEFDGTLPTTLPVTLEELDLSNNQLTGTIPSTWTKAKALGRVLLNNNLLSGKTPTIYKSLSNLDAVMIAGNNYSLKDWFEWRTFAKKSDMKFLFGRQRPYSDNRRIDLKKGELLTVDMPYPKDLIGDEVYEWYNLTLKEKVGGQSTSQLKLSGVTIDDACRYVCLIRSPQLKVAEKSKTQAAKGSPTDNWDFVETQPTLVSGFVDVYVDGNTTIGVDRPTSREPLVYPTVSQQGEGIQVLHPEKVRSISFTDATGTLLGTYDCTTALQSSRSLMPGVYFVSLVLLDGKTETLLIVIE